MYNMGTRRHKTQEYVYKLYHMCINISVCFLSTMPNACFILKGLQTMRAEYQNALFYSFSQTHPPILHYLSRNFFLCRLSFDFISTVNRRTSRRYKRLYTFLSTCHIYACMHVLYFFPWLLLFFCKLNFYKQAFSLKP